MKKILTLLLSLLMIISLVGCKSKKEEVDTHIHQYEVDEDGVWICTEDNDILSDTDKPYVAVLENNEPKDIILLDSITSKKTNLGNGVIYKEDNTIFYNGNNAQTIIIKTEKDNKNNEDKVVINAPNDTVYHYGSSSVISLDAVATNSFHEYGKVDLITLTVARIVLETLSNVKEIYLDINNPSYNYETSVIAIKEEVEIPKLSRDTVDLKEGEVKTLAVIQQLKDETKQDNTVETKTEEESFVKIENIAKSDNDLIIQAFLSPNADVKDNTKLEKTQTSTTTLEEAKEGSNHPASKNVFVSKDEKVIEIVKPIDTSKQEETKKQELNEQYLKPILTPSITPIVTPSKKETKKDDPKPTPSVTKYTVTFDMQGHGTQIDPQSIEKGNKATKPTDPTATGYTFGGWYKEDTCTNAWNFNTDVVTANTTLYAKWTANTYKVIFDSKTNGGSLDNQEMNETYDSKYVLPVRSPIKMGYDFNGWFTDINGGTKITTESDVKITENVTLYAQFTPIIYSWTFDANGGKWSDSSTTKTVDETYDSKYVLPESKPTKDGYDFDGWWTAKTGGNKITEDTVFKADSRAIYAHWVNATPVDVANYTLKGQVWFTALTSGTEINKDSITDIIFSKAAPTGEKVVDGVDLTANTTGKVKGYIVVDGENYKIYIVGDYIFGNVDCTQMFYGFKNLKNLDLSNFDTSEVTNMYCMFSGCSSLTSITFGEGFDTAKVTTMYMMFNSCSALKSLDLSKFNTASVTTMKQMFSTCSKLESITFGDKFNAENVTDMCSMFFSCSALTSLDLSKFNSKSAQNMNTMFQNCSSLSEITFGTNFNTASVTTMEKMFNNCTALTTLDLNSFNTVNVSNMSNMFSGCSKLTSLNLSNFNTGNVTNMGDMFKGCSKLTLVEINAANEKIKTALGDGWAYGNGAYTKNPVKYTIAEILPDNFPTSSVDLKTPPNNAWVAKGGQKCYIYGDKIYFLSGSSAPYETLSTTVEKTDDGYITDYLSFEIKDGELVSITFNDSLYPKLCDTYRPALQNLMMLAPITINKLENDSLLIKTEEQIQTNEDLIEEVVPIVELNEEDLTIELEEQIQTEEVKTIEDAPVMEEQILEIPMVEKEDEESFIEENVLESEDESVEVNQPLETVEETEIETPESIE